MAISVTDIGSNGNSTGATVAVTIPAGGVPSGAVIVVVTGEGSGVNFSTGGSMSDTVNTYSQITHLNNGTNLGYGVMWHADNVSALTSANSITWTKQTSGDVGVISAFYATGVSASPLDTAVTASTAASTSTPSITSGTPSVAGELIVGGLTGTPASNGTLTFTNGGSFVTPFDTVNSSVSGSGSATAAGGHEINAGSAAVTFSGTLSAARANAIFVVGFKPAPPSGFGGQTISVARWSQPWAWIAALGVLAAKVLGYV